MMRNHHGRDYLRDLRRRPQHRDGFPGRRQGGARTLKGLPIPKRDGGYTDLRAAADAAATGLAEDEAIADVPSAQYVMRRDGGVSGNSQRVVTVRTTGSPDQTGWLFFGLVKT
ncbi:hypothetical protein [Haloechinothrix halophila]|uniref:hypothetical protein n=1 Tax=Haloechinothrix halophila TaxID=1069073 RepID=UPI00040EB38F|nr:hypothetical protein [Haloechinothrix halophila]